MENLFRYRGKNYSQSDIHFIKQLIDQNPDDSRRALSKKLCLAWDWKQENGALRDMVCRSFMLELHRSGLITLPPKKLFPKNNIANRKQPVRIPIDQSPLQMKLSDLVPIHFQQVRQSKQEALCNSLIDEFHYLGYCQPVGEHLKYLISAKNRPIACMTWSSAPRHIGDRDRFIGWSPKIRVQNIKFIAYNSRFLILPWVRVKHLASYLLGRATKIVSSDWHQLYCHPIHYFETFVDTERYSGTCYYAANWQFIGMTTGLGKDSRSSQVNRSLKAILGYPLSKKFRSKLGVPNEKTKF